MYISDVIKVLLTYKRHVFASLEYKEYNFLSFILSVHHLIFAYMHPFHFWQTLSVYMFALS